MSRITPAGSAAISPRQVLLLVLLLGILVAVNFWPEGKNAETSSVDLPQAQPVSLTTRSSDVSSRNQFRSVWPEYVLDSVMENNPFKTILSATVTASKPDSKTADEETKSATPQASSDRLVIDQVAVVYEDATGRVALVDSQVVRVGDRLPQGRVIEISHDHVVLDPTDQLSL